MSECEWVEIIGANNREHMFANLSTGQCSWEPPPNVKVKPTHDNQWWELFDSKTARHYYYNATTQRTVWHKPKDGDIIHLTKLQMLKESPKVWQKSAESARCNEYATPGFVVKTEYAKPGSVIPGEYVGSSVLRDNINGALNPATVSNNNNLSEVNTLHSVKPNSELINGDRKCSTLPRLGPSPRGKPSHAFSSFRHKAPPKPPRNNFDNMSITVERSDSKRVIASNSSTQHKATHTETSAPPRNASPVYANPPKPSEITAKPFNATDSPKYANAIPVPPPPPPLPLLPGNVKKLRKQENTKSYYDNVTLSMYDNMSDDDDFSTPTILSPDVTMEMSASSDEALTPSGTLLHHADSSNAAGNRTSCYERFHDAPTPHNHRKGSENDRINAPVKRSPLTRMKSDTLDVEKRAKFSKPSVVSGTGFRPTSMLNLSMSGPSKQTRKLSTSAVEVENAPPLSTHRTGLLRRRMSIHSMLSWSKSAIKKPMVLTRHKRIRKEAVETFKLILQYMGDKSTRKSLDHLAVDITTKGWNTSALRDEIYIQLCKQTTGNDKSTSLTRGWELITACLSLFPPSNKLHSYLEGYIYRHLEPDENTTEVPIDLYAKHCYKQLERICQTGAKRGLKGPNVDEIQSAIKRVFNPSMFGNTLEDIMEMQTSRFPEYRLPWILTTLTQAVLIQNGLQTEGIFRIPGDIDEVNSLKLEVDQWNVPENINDPYVPASLLKLWFRDLYEPLIPQRFYDQCVHNCDNTDVCLNIVNSLPDLNRIVFSYLIRLLQAFMIEENVHHSKMDENNLAMVWAPNCLRCPSNDPREIFDSTRKEMTFLRVIMKALDTSFLEGIV